MNFISPKWQHSTIYNIQRTKYTRNALDCDQSNYSSRIVFSHTLIDFGPTRNSAIRSADPENLTLRTKHGVTQAKNPRRVHHYTIDLLLLHSLFFRTLIENTLACDVILVARQHISNVVCSFFSIAYVATGAEETNDFTTSVW